MGPLMAGLAESIMMGQPLLHNVDSPILILHGRNEDSHTVYTQHLLSIVHILNY